MTTITNSAPLIIDPMLSPLDQFIERTARILRLGAVANAILAAGILLLGILGALQIIPDIFQTLKNVFLINATHTSDLALLIIAVLCLLNMSFLLVVMVGILSRELWSLPLLFAFVLANLFALFVWGFIPALISLAALSLAIFAIFQNFALFRRLFRVNPVMIKELRGRMRGARAFVVLGVYLGLMGSFALLLYMTISSVAYDSNSSAAGGIGRALFQGIFVVELLLIIFIAPSFTAGSIAGERERQTYDLLQTTLLSNSSFVMGKLESALGYIVLLLLAGIPLQSFAFLFGGVTETELILSLVILLITSVALGTSGIFFSSSLSRTLSATLRAYGTIVGVMFIAPLVIGLFTSLLIAVAQTFLGNTHEIFEAIVIYLRLLTTSINPLTAALETQQLIIDQQVIGFYSTTLMSNGQTIPMASPWIVFSIIYLAASSILMTITIRNKAKLTDEETP